MKKMFSDAVSAGSAQVALYWIAITKCGMYVFGSLCGAILAALSGMDWADATAQTKFMMFLGIGISFANTIGAYLDQSLKRAQDGKDPLTGLSLPPFATQAQVDAGVSTKTLVSPATLANTPAVKAADEQLPKVP